MAGAGSAWLNGDWSKVYFTLYNHGFFTQSQRVFFFFLNLLLGGAFHRRAGTDLPG